MTEQEYIDKYLNKFFTYTRVGDGKVFKIKVSGHWTDIVAEDGETDTVKFAFCANWNHRSETYISAFKAHKYERTRNNV